jgi:hypothetical protein
MPHPKTRSRPSPKPGSKPRRRRRRGRRFRACPPIALLAGGVLLVMAVPRFMSALVQLPGNYVPQRLERGETVGDAALSKLASTRRGSLEWISGGQQWLELGLAQLRQAERSPENRGILLPRAVAALRQGLTLKPANSPGWLWLAEAELLRGGASPAVARAIGMSVRTAPLDRRYYMRRLEISLLSWSYLDIHARQAVAGQVRFASRKFADRLAGLTQRSEYRTLVRRILDNAPTG